MAINVTHRGTPPTEIRYAGRCHQCHSTMTCLAADGQLKHGEQQRDPGDWVEIQCPVCKGPVNCYPEQKRVHGSAGGYDQPALGLTDR